MSDAMTFGLSPRELRDAKITDEHTAPQPEPGSSEAVQAAWEQLKQQYFMRLEKVIMAPFERETAPGTTADQSTEPGA